MLRGLLVVVMCLGAILLTLLTLVASVLNLAMATQIWYMIIFGGAAATLVIAAIVAVLMRFVKKQICWRPIKLLMVIMGVFVLQLPLYFTFNAAVSWSARRYISSRLPRLEAYRQQQGRYPGDLNEVLKDDGKLPELLCRWWAYSVYNDRSTFKVEVYHPFGNGRYLFDQTSHVWKAQS